MPRFAPLATLLIVLPFVTPVRAGDRDEQARTVLDDLGRKAFRWFQDNRHPETGLVRDRAPNWRGSASPSSMASIASAGYYLSILPEAVRTGDITKAQAEANAYQLLRFLRDRMHHEHGLFFHFVDWQTGERWSKCEISVLDSAILFNGCMVVSEAFGGRVADLTNQLLERVEWARFLTQHPTTKKPVLSLGWQPETGLIGSTDFRSSEMAMPYFLAVGQRARPLDPECWYNTPAVYQMLCGFKILNTQHPLFTSYYGLGWHDLHGRPDRTGIDLEANAKLAAKANRAFCREIANKHRTFALSEGQWWGISAGDSPAGYVAPGPILSQLDGTAWPTAALAALPWDADEIQEDLLRWKASKVWKRVYGEYGLSPFNLEQNWIAPDVIGIDLGSFAVSLANYRNHTVWDLWMRHPVAVAALERLGFKSALASAPVAVPAKPGAAASNAPAPATKP
jgi:hypothetical protein